MFTPDILHAATKKAAMSQTGSVPGLISGNVLSPVRREQGRENFTSFNCSSALYNSQPYFINEKLFNRKSFKIYIHKIYSRSSSCTRESLTFSHLFLLKELRDRKIRSKDNQLHLKLLFVKKT